LANLVPIWFHVNLVQACITGNYVFVWMRFCTGRKDMHGDPGSRAHSSGIYGIAMDRAEAAVFAAEAPQVSLDL
jgi:hypothetical protein